MLLPILVFWLPYLIYYVYWLKKKKPYKRRYK